MDYKKVVINVTVTFVEGFIAAWAITGNRTDKAALTGAVASAVSVVWNTAIKPVLKSKGVL